jgi:hypothetical protein
VGNVHLTLSLLSDRLAVCRLAAQAEIPAWATRHLFFSITRSADELSVICPEHSVPADVQREMGWRALTVDGPLDFSAIGVLASLAQPLADAGVSILAIATYDTDYILVRAADLPAAICALEERGYKVQQ